MISFTRFMSFVGLVGLALLFLVMGSFHLDWAHKGQAPGIEASLRFQLPQTHSGVAEGRHSFGGWLKHLMVVSFGEKSERSLIDQLTHPQANVDNDVPHYRVTPASVGRRLKALVRVGPYLGQPSACLSTNTLPPPAVETEAFKGRPKAIDHISDRSASISSVPAVSKPVQPERDPAHVIQNPSPKATLKAAKAGASVLPPPPIAHGAL